MRILLATLGFLMISVNAAEKLDAATFTSTPLAGTRVYPNPWRADRHTHFLVTFDGLPPQTPLHLFTLAGQEIKTLVSDPNGKILWDRTNKEGQAVASGLYLYAISSKGQTSIGKVVIIR